MRNNEAGVDFILIKELLGGILYLIHKTIYYVMNETFCKKERLKNVVCFSFCNRAKRPGVIATHINRGGV